jgi:hypothetical protein
MSCPGEKFSPILTKKIQGWIFPTTEKFRYRCTGPIFMRIQSNNILRTNSGDAWVFMRNSAILTGIREGLNVLAIM